MGNVGIRKINYLENSNLNITFLRQLQNNLTQDRVLAFELHEYKDSNGNLNFHRLKSINEMYIDEVVFFIEKIIVPLFKDELKIPIELSTFFMELTLHAERICISINDLTTDSSFIGARCDEGKKLVATRKLYALNQTILQFECQKNTLFACMKAYAWWPSPIKVPKGILKVQEKTRAIIKLLKHTFIDSNLTAPVIQFILQSFPIMGYFPPINGVEQVQNYIDRLENSLPCNGDFELPQFKNVSYLGSITAQTFKDLAYAGTANKIEKLEKKEQARTEVLVRLDLVAEKRKLNHPYNEADISFKFFESNDS